MTRFPRPSAGEYNEYYAGYVGLVPEGSVLEILRDQLADTLALLDRVPPARETFRYAPGKWSLREVVGHLIDVERVFSFRALAMARADGVDLPGIEQDEWVERSGAHRRPLGDMAKEWIAVRRSAVHMFASLPTDVETRSGRASGFDFTVRSFPWMIAGHERWHRKLIERDYLGAGA